jgi:predicted ATPase
LITNIKNMNDLQYGLQNPIFYAMLADLERERNPETAFSTLERALHESARSGNVFFDAALHRRRGQYLRRMSTPDLVGAETAFKQAVLVAQAQGARTHKLLASFDLARLYCDTAREQGAHYILAPALVGFDPTPELPEIAEAQKLLASLGQESEARSAAGLARNDSEA